MTWPARHRRHLPGDWRARARGGAVSHVAHLWPAPATSRTLPACGARILRASSSAVYQPMYVERCCYSCLAAGAAGRVEVAP